MAERKERKGRNRKFVVATTLVVALGIGVASMPASAFSEAAIVAAIMKVLGYIKGTVVPNIKEGFEKSTESVIKNDRYLHNLDIDFWQTPGTFCPADQKMPEQLAKASETSAYNAAVRYATEVQRYSGNSAKGAAAFNQRFHEAVQRASEGGSSGSGKEGSSCDPRIPVPIESDGNLASCDQQSLDLQNEALTGFDPLPAIPEEMKNQNVGNLLDAIRNSTQVRRALAAQTQARINNPYQRNLIKAYRKYLSKPTVEELEKMSAAGGVARDQTVLMQLQGQLMLNIYIELQQQNRLLATLVAQMTEQDERMSQLKAQEIQARAAKR